MQFIDTCCVVHVCMRLLMCVRFHSRCVIILLIVITTIMYTSHIVEQYSTVQYVPVSEYSLTLMHPQSGQLIFTSNAPLIAHKHALENLWE